MPAPRLRDLVDLDFTAELFPDDGVVSRAGPEASVRKPRGQKISVTSTCIFPSGKMQ